MLIKTVTCCSDCPFSTFDDPDEYPDKTCALIHSIPGSEVAFHGILPNCPLLPDGLVVCLDVQRFQQSLSALMSKCLSDLQ